MHRARARSATSVFDRAARRTALREAERAATAELDSMRGSLARQHRQQQEQLDGVWGALLGNDESAVLACLATAFADNDAPAAPLGVEGDQVSLVVVVPSPDVLPERKPALTRAGNLSLKKLTKSELALLYKQLVLAHVLLTLNEAFAVAPGLRSARITAIRQPEDRAHGAEVLIAAVAARESISASRWDHLDAIEASRTCLEDLVIREKGVTRSLQPIDLRGEPELQQVVDTVDFASTPEPRPDAQRAP